MLGAAGGLEFFRQVLELRGYRQQILSADLANASTPGFKAVDLDFREALAAAAAPDTADRIWLVDDPRQLPRPGGGAPKSAAGAVKYLIDRPVTLDGNSVDLDREKVAAADNGVQYEAAATFASQTIKMLATAIGGSSPSGAGA
jgi:flagellar basal-body rod protein FlgB